MDLSSPLTPSGAADFATATAITEVGDGVFALRLSADWSIGKKPHGGYLMAVLAKAGVAALGGGLDPLALSCEFLRPPAIGEAVVRAAVRKKGRTVSTVTLSLEQEGRECVTGTLTIGKLPEVQAEWAALPDFPVEPEADAFDLSKVFDGGPSKMSQRTQLWMSRHNARLFTERKPGDPLQLRGWVRQPDGDPDLPYALVVGDILPPLTFNLGNIGWTPTVQLTALLRANPAPGWLRVQTECRTVAGGWFDSDAIVLDSAGTLICQARQLAMTPR